MFKFFKRKEKVVLPREDFKVHDFTHRKMCIVQNTKDNVSVLAYWHRSLAVNWDGSDSVEVGDLIHHQGTYLVVLGMETVQVEELARRYHVTVHNFLIDHEKNSIEFFKSKKVLDKLEKKFKKEYKIVRMKKEK